MKNIVTVLSIISMFTAFAGEREVLLKTFEKENRAAENDLQNAMTQIEITGAVGNSWHIAETQMLRALDYKLRHTDNAAERLKLLTDFHRLSRDVQKIYDTPRESMGSMAGMQIYSSIAFNMQQFTAVLMLDSEAEKQWKQISDAKLELHGKKIKLSRGKAKFDAVMYDENVALQIILFPKDVFAFQNRLFAIIRTNIEFAGNDDFSKIYLCEMKNGKLQVIATLKMPYFSKWVLQNNKILFFDRNNVKEEFVLQVTDAPIKFDKVRNGYYLAHHGWNFSCPQIYDENNMKFLKQPVNEGNPQMIMRANNGVHPARAGYRDGRYA